MKKYTLSDVPSPFLETSFLKLREGIFDDPNIDVYMTETGDFACLSPLPTMDYENYKPRAQSLSLKSYRASTGIYDLRYEKIADYLQPGMSMLEIGAGDADFLAYIHDRKPDVDLSCVEPDDNTKAHRDRHSWLHQALSTDVLQAHTYDIVSCFHVLEHIEEPSDFLSVCANLIKPGGKVIIEVPSLTDPLLSLYAIPQYEDFYFQKQHPYYYSPASLQRLLEHNGYAVEAMIAHQRYGLENHLAWLTQGKPGGNEQYRRIFADTSDSYRASLETVGNADSVIAIATRAHP